MNNTLVITGGSKGIGLAIAFKYLQEGWTVISGSRSVKKDVPDEFKTRFHQLEIDVKNRSSHENLAKAAIDQTGQLDCYINNAGFSEWRTLENIDEDFLNLILQTNLMSYFWGCQAASKSLAPNGSIINISSLAAKRGTPNNSAYVASKFGVAGLTQSLAKELGPRGIRVNSVCPVLVRTEGLISALSEAGSPGHESPEEFLKLFAKTQTALGFLPSGSQVADACFYLSGSNASAITGQSLNIDCGVLPN